MAEEHTTLNEEKLLQLIRNIFQKEFKKLEVHVTNITSSNFKITMEEINKLQEQINQLKKEVTDLKSLSIQLQISMTVAIMLMRSITTR